MTFIGARRAFPVIAGRDSSPAALLTGRWAGELARALAACRSPHTPSPVFARCRDHVRQPVIATKRRLDTALPTKVLVTGMTVLEAGPVGWLRPRLYAITRDGTIAGDLKFGATYQSADIALGAARFVAGTEGMLGGKFQLTSNGRRVASAVRSGLHRSLAVQADTRILLLKPASPFGRGFTVVENDAPIGSIAPASWFSRKCRAQLPDDLAPEIQVFLIWLVLLIWWRLAFTATMVGAITAATGSS